MPEKEIKVYDGVSFHRVTLEGCSSCGTCTKREVDKKPIPFSEVTNEMRDPYAYILKDRNIPPLPLPPLLPHRERLNAISTLFEQKKWAHVNYFSEYGYRLQLLNYTNYHPYIYFIDGVVISSYCCYRSNSFNSPYPYEQRDYNTEWSLYGVQEEKVNELERVIREEIGKIEQKYILKIETKKVETEATEVKRTIGDFLREKRTASGLTQKKVAGLVGLKQEGYLSVLETDRKCGSSTRELLTGLLPKILEVLGTNSEEMERYLQSEKH